MKVETEIRAMLPQAKDHLGPPEAERGRKNSPQKASEGVSPSWQLDFGLLASEL